MPLSDNRSEMPLTVRRSIELLGVCALGTLIVVGQSVIMPLVMAFFVALLLLPLMRWLKGHGVPEMIAIFLCIFLLFLVIAGVATFLSLQIAGFLSDFDTIQSNLLFHWNRLSAWISGHTQLTMDEQLTAIKKQGEGLGQNVAGYFSSAFSSIGNIFVFLGLLPIYIFLILFYRNLLVRFLYMWFQDDVYARLHASIKEMEEIIKYYLFGLMIQIAYLTVLLGGILLIFGIKHAILIGVTFAILNLIPYVGALIGNLIGVLLTLTTSQEMWQIWAVLGTIALVQFLDNNILMPRIVGSKVKVNALASIVSIVLGGSLAGVTGMFLSIPIMAVLKIVFDKSEHLRQWGFLLGDHRPEHSPTSGVLSRLKRSRKNKEEDTNSEEQ